MVEPRFRRRYLRSIDSLKAMFNEQEVENQLLQALEKLTTTKNKFDYLHLFRVHSPTIINNLNLVSGLLLQQLHLEDKCQQISFNFSDIIGASITSYAQNFVINLSIQDVVLSVSPSGYPFAILTRAMSHEFFHIYLAQRYEKRNLESAIASELKRGGLNTLLYDIDLVELACELYAVKFMRQLIPLFAEKNRIQLALSQLSLEVESVIQQRLKRRQEANA